jgi:copper chaperone CopZ
MAEDVAGDQLAIIQIEGMHCHKCEAAICQSLHRIPGVHEVEVDFPSRQASILFDPRQVKLQWLIDAIRRAGYRPGNAMTNADSGNWITFA